jgi:transcriptional regulator with XRE-family HTH domain
MILSKMLIHCMQQKQLSFTKLSRLSGVSKSTLHGWTTGRRVRDLSELQRVARILEISIHKLVFGESDPFEEKSEEKAQECLQEIFSGELHVTIHKKVPLVPE